MTGGELKDRSRAVGSNEEYRTDTKENPEERAAPSQIVILSEAKNLAAERSLGRVEKRISSINAKIL